MEKVQKNSVSFVVIVFTLTVLVLLEDALLQDPGSVLS
jgi:hypothetical protein